MRAVGIRRRSGTYALTSAHRRHRDRDQPTPSVAAGTGWAVYVGSAFGPGGAAAQLAHHRRRRSPAWHRLSEKSRRLAGGLDHPRSNPSRMSMGDGAAGGFGRRAATVSFGASDCRCPLISTGSRIDRC